MIIGTCIEHPSRQQQLSKETCLSAITNCIQTQGCVVSLSSYQASTLPQAQVLLRSFGETSSGKPGGILHVTQCHCILNPRPWAGPGNEDSATVTSWGTRKMQDGDSLASSRGHACTQQPQLPVTSPHMAPCHMHNSCRLSFPFSDSGATGSIQRRSCDCKYYTHIHTRLPRENAAVNEYLSRLFSGCVHALLHIVTYSGSERTEISNTEN